MSDNTFWLLIWVIVGTILIGFFGMVSYTQTGIRIQHEKMYSECIKSGMQYVSGNCIAGPFIKKD